MLSVVRYSQIVGLITVDGATAKHLGEIQDIWVDEEGRIVYLSSTQEYIPLEQLAGVNPQAVTTYGYLPIRSPHGLQRLHQLVVRSTFDESLGWLEDVLFDWQTGEVKAYILAGSIATALGGRAVCAPDDIQAITAEALILKGGAPNRLRSEAEGLKGFLSEKHDQVRQLVQEMSDQLMEAIAPHELPEVVRVKIKTVGDEMATSGHADRHVLQEATDFLHDQWESLQHSLRRAKTRAQRALESAWEHLAEP